METLIQLAFEIGPFLLLLMFGFLIGTLLERNHYTNIRKRETKTRAFPMISFRRPPPSWQVKHSTLVTGSTVVSVDYFKRFLAGFRAIFGGRVTSYESLLDRARREAILRMKEQAIAKEFDAIVNLRLETSRLANSQRKGKGTAGVEILAFGTAVKYGK